jgi:hypothetical protein
MVEGEFKAWNPYQGWQPILFPKSVKVPAARGVTSAIADLENYTPRAGEGMGISMTPEEKASFVAAVGTDVIWLANSASVQSIPGKVRELILEWGLKLENWELWARAYHSLQLRKRRLKVVLLRLEAYTIWPEILVKSLVSRQFMLVKRLATRSTGCGGQIGNSDEQICGRIAFRGACPY